ncbi:hypothetical protein K461DRAFT_321664 [Myriangium duriaei CBS 260.36]|uniref:Complex III subunit 9 n=1 Tax=Myriangium duriaei CBS 260.36 TaxID=1168546 RepID=A0A9P4J104_9PEZI|nr:hypothetical protein K461DRAFT_321664 [Myriangium duriaei CBS 260.36]
MSSALSSVYNTIFKRNYVFLSTVFVSAFACELAFDNVSNTIWDSINRGRQWKDIKYRYVTKPESDDDDDDE